MEEGGGWGKVSLAGSREFWLGYGTVRIVPLSSLYV